MKELLSLARKTLEFHLKGKKLIIPESIKEKYSEKKACFVTLTKKNELRGCIGTLYPRQALYQDIVENAINAGFNDFRFPSLRENELLDIRIEISVLSVPERLEFKDNKELLKKIDKNMGIILKKGYNSATFLPQVWEEIPDKIEFLEHLSAKTGLEKNAWKDAEIYSYRVEKIKEK
ncbi:MAG: AmmeMemoRadiSam system protein A [Candidatus Pacearchaeota archaeon]|nr:AmmeMemoRadiSam system protein A [Candidatus Pacearchaeota archaeon]